MRKFNSKLLEGGWEWLDLEKEPLSCGKPIHMVFDQ